jgi:hypothetical protein
MSEKYLVFRGYSYYPSGGIEDFIGTTESLEEGKKLICKEGECALDQHLTWWQIVDKKTMKTVEEKYNY